MAVTIDFTLRGEVEESELELALVRQGQRIEVIQDTLQGPLAQIDLPHPCEDLVDMVSQQRKFSTSPSNLRPRGQL